MGACFFINVVKRKSAKDANDAFKKEVAQSQYESGHSYSGEIGMKRDFVRAKTKRCSTLNEACDEADRLVEDERYSDKWGPAFLIEVDGNEGGWVFFGWASS